MQQFKSVSIRKHIIALITVLTVVPLGFMVYSLSVERNRQVKEAINKASIHTEQISKLISQITGNTELLLNMVSRLPSVKTGDEKTVNDFLLDLVNQYPQFSSIFIVDHFGRRWATTNQMTGPVSYSDRRYFANAISSGRFSSGEYAIGKVKKKPLFSFALPVKSSSGTITNIAVASIELSGIKDLLLNDLSRDRMTVIVTDHVGKILLHSTVLELEGKQEDDAVFRQILQGSEEATIETEGSRKLLAYKKLHLPGEKSPYMYVLVLADKDLLLKEPNEKFVLNLAILLVAVIFSLVIAYRISKRFMLDKVEESEQRHRALFDKTESLHRMAGAIAHTFNNQLGVVIGNLEMVLDDLPKGTKPFKSLTSAMNASQRAAEMSGLMLSYLGQTHDKHEPLDLSGVFLPTLQILRSAVPVKIRLETDLPYPGPVISANPTQMQQLLTNLVTNAWEAFSEDGGVIDVRVTTVSPIEISTEHRQPINWHPQDNAYACLGVRDTGCGIEEKDIDKIFDPFFTSKFIGRGMGLAVVLGIVREHDGAITVESEPGRGSMFKVFLPVSAKEASRKPEIRNYDANLQQAAPIINSTIKPTGNGIILLVDDEDMLYRQCHSAPRSLG
jgi:signal transduction histidine kinase